MVVPRSRSEIIRHGSPRYEPEDEREDESREQSMSDDNRTRQVRKVTRVDRSNATPFDKVHAECESVLPRFW